MWWIKLNHKKKLCVSCWAAYILQDATRSLQYQFKHLLQSSIQCGPCPYTKNCMVCLYTPLWIKAKLSSRNVGNHPCIDAALQFRRSDSSTIQFCSSWSVSWTLYMKWMPRYRSMSSVYVRISYRTVRITEPLQQPNWRTNCWQCRQRPGEVRYQKYHTYSQLSITRRYNKNLKLSLFEEICVQISLIKPTFMYVMKAWLFLYCKD